MPTQRSDESTVEIILDGESFQVPTERTVAAALMLEAKDRGWRTTRFREQPRGAFCGIGICFDCLATVDSQPCQRTCLIQVKDGMNIETGDCNAAR